MAAPASPEVEERRAFRQALRNVSRLLRGVGTLLVVVGLGGLLVGDSGDWWVGPSWVSLAIGVAVLAAGVVRRVRLGRNGTDSPPEA